MVFVNRILRNTLCVIAAGVLISPANAHARSLEGQVVAVQDGDTVTLLDAHHDQYRIRLGQIDAPEKAQPFGQRSKESLSDLVYGKQVTAECQGKDRYDRLICRIVFANDDINLEQVRRGMAWVYRKYARDEAYYRIEDEARNAKRGLWADPNPVPPWDWRHRVK